MGTLLAAGTRGGDVLVYGAETPRDALALHAAWRASHKIQQLCWSNDGRLAVHTRDAMHVLVWDDGRLTERDVVPVGAAHVTLLSWGADALHWATLQALWTWTDGAPSAAPCEGPAAGLTRDDRVVMADGRVWTWDGSVVETLDVPTPLVRYAADPSTGIVATLHGADETALWTYTITPRLTYTLWLPAPEAPLSLARAPAVAWRAVALAGAVGPATLEGAARRVDEVQRAAADAMAKGSDAWALWHHDMRALAWGAACVDPVPDALAAAQWLATWLGYVCGADAAQDAAQQQRAAAALALLAQDSRATQAERDFLTARAAALAPAGAGAAVPCPACAAPVPMALGAHARCENGHWMDRCVATLAVVNDQDVWACTGCGRVAISSALREHDMSGCPACGNRWRVL